MRKVLPIAGHQCFYKPKPKPNSISPFPHRTVVIPSSTTSLFSSTGLVSCTYLKSIILHGSAQLYHLHISLLFLLDSFSSDILIPVLSAPLYSARRLVTQSRRGDHQQLQTLVFSQQLRKGFLPQFHVEVHKKMSYWSNFAYFHSYGQRKSGSCDGRFH